MEKDQPERQMEKATMLHPDAVEPQAQAQAQVQAQPKGVMFQLGEGEEDELNEDQYEIGKRLGRGSFATVYLTRHTLTDKKVVIKRLDRIQPHQAEQVQLEVEMMKEASGHPNLVAYKGFFRTRDSNTLCIVMNYCDGGSMADVLKNMDSGVFFTEEQIMGWFIQTALAVHHLHERNIIHRDLKPGNIFLSKNHSIVKIGDLGIAKKMNDAFEMATTMMGTPYYMSPELIANRPYSSKADIWSLGCILYEMAARKTAFEAKGMPQLMVKIMRNAYKPLPSHLSRQFTGLVGAMLRVDPDARPTASQLLQLPFVRMHAERLLAQSISPQIDVAIQSIIESPLDPGADRGYAKERPITAVSVRTNAGRPKTGKSVKGKSGKKGKGGGKTGKLGRTQNVNLQTVKVSHHNAKEWDAGAQYEQRQAQMREMRHQAREMEQRLGREVARQHRKATDPAERAKEERKQRQMGAMLKERGRRAIAEAEAALLRPVMEDLAAGKAGCRTYDKLGRSVPGINEIEGEDNDKLTANLQDLLSDSRGPSRTTSRALLSSTSFRLPVSESSPKPAPLSAAGMRVRNVIDDLINTHGDELGSPERSLGSYGDEDEDEDADLGILEDRNSGSDDDSNSEEGEEESDEEESGESGESGEDSEEEGQHDDDEDNEEDMENKLAAVWESDPMERMGLLEKMWKKSVRDGKKSGPTSPRVHGAGASARPSDPNQLLGHLGDFFVRDETSAVAETECPGGRQGALPPLVDEKGRAVTPPASIRVSKQAESSLISNPEELTQRLSNSDTHQLKPMPPVGPAEKQVSRRSQTLHTLEEAAKRKQTLTTKSIRSKKGQMRPRQHSHEDLKPLAQHETSSPRRSSTPDSYDGSIRPFSPPEDDPLLKAIALKRVLTQRGESGSLASSSNSPSAGLSPLHKSIAHMAGSPARSGGWSSSPTSSAHLSPQLHPPMRAPLSPAMMSTRGLLDAAAGLHNANPTDKGLQRKAMAGDFMRVLAANSSRSLPRDVMSSSEDSAALAMRLLDPSLPQRMMELDLKQRQAAGEDVQPNLRPPVLGLVPDQDALPGPSAHSTPDKDSSPPKARAKASRRSVQFADMPEAPLEPKEPQDAAADEEGLMYTAFLDQMREIRRWRNTLMSGSQSHELAAQELRDRAASISNPNSHKSMLSSAPTTGAFTAAGSGSDDDNDDDDDDVINL